MIPKTIHYCWFGGNPLPNEYKRYMESWKKLCPEFKIIEWNENNFNVTQNRYCYEAYNAQKWAFVSDYARLKIIYEYGGIYLDTDVEIIKSLLPLISSGTGFLGFQNSEEVNTGLGFAAEQYNSCIKKMLEIYEGRIFLKKDGTFDLTPCPVANTVALKQCGLRTGRKNCKEIQHLEGLDIYPIEYLNPMNADTLKMNITENSYTIHHYSASWYSEKQICKKKIKAFIPTPLLQIRTLLISRRDIKKFDYFVSFYIKSNSIGDQS